MKNTLHGSKKQISMIPLVQESLILKKWINDQCLNFQKQNKMKKQFLAYWIILTNGEINMRREDKEL